MFSTSLFRMPTSTLHPEHIHKKRLATSTICPSKILSSLASVIQNDEAIILSSALGMVPEAKNRRWWSAKRGKNVIVFWHVAKLFLCWMLIQGCVFQVASWNLNPSRNLQVYEASAEDRGVYLGSFWLYRTIVFTQTGKWLPRSRKRLLGLWIGGCVWHYCEVWWWRVDEEKRWVRLGAEVYENLVWRAFYKQKCERARKRTQRFIFLCAFKYGRNLLLYCLQDNLYYS